MKVSICIAVGIFGSFFAGLFGGWDVAVTVLLIFMGIDYVTGMVLAGVFHKSPKTQGGGLESKAGWKGLVRKGVTLLLVVAATQLDRLLGTSYLRDGVCIAFLCNELLSILENAGLMGIPLPRVLVEAVEVLQRRQK